MTRDFYPLYSVDHINQEDVEQSPGDVYWNLLSWGDSEVENIILSEVDATDFPRGIEKIRTSLLVDRILNTKSADKIPDDVLTQILINADTNKDGYIDKQEFNQLVKNVKRKPLVKAALRDAVFLVVPRSGRDVHIRRYVDEFSCNPPALFMILITIAEIIGFLYYGITYDSFTGSSTCPLSSPFIYNPSRRYEAWRFVSYMFIHCGWVHLLNNIVVQLFLGILLEMVHKWWRLMLVYLLGVIGGSLASSVGTPDVYLAGASGGVYAVEYAYAGNLILNWGEMRHPWIQLLILMVLTFTDFGYAIYDFYFSSHPSNTGHMAHLGGALTGIFIGTLVLRNLTQERWEFWVRLVMTLIWTSVFSAIVIVNIVSPDGFFPRTDKSPLKFE